MQKTLEGYLNSLRAEMSAMPADKREAEIQEIRDHLEALVLDFRQAGYGEEVAVAKALHRFGTSRANGRALRRVWKRQNSWMRSPLSLWRGLLAASVAALLLVCGLGSLRSVSTPASYPSSASGDSVLYVIERQHQIEVQAIQRRWQADNLAIQRMDKSQRSAVLQAQRAAASRFEGEMNMANYRHQANIKTFQRQTLLTFTVLPLAGVALLMGAMLVIFRRRASANLKKLPLT